MASEITSINESDSFIRIETTAYDLFGYYGIKRISIEELCKKSNVSKSTFYKHFSNKNELVQHLVINLLKNWEDQFNQILIENLPFN